MGSVDGRFGMCNEAHSPCSLYRAGETNYIHRVIPSELCLAAFVLVLGSEKSRVLSCEGWDEGDGYGTRTSLSICYERIWVHFPFLSESTATTLVTSLGLDPSEFSTP